MPKTNPRFSVRLVVTIVLLMIAAGVSFFWFDQYLDDLLRLDRRKIPGDLKELLEYTSVFGHGFSTLVVILLIWRLDPANRRALKLIVATTISTGVVTTLLKIIVHRVRPIDLEELQHVDITVHGVIFRNAIQSFPSGHTASAFVLAGLLTILYPRGKGLFFTFAILTGVQRVISGNHYPSDVFAGAMIGVAAVAIAKWIWTREVDVRILIGRTKAH